jgi:chromosome segregation ATPase
MRNSKRPLLTGVCFLFGSVLFLSSAMAADRNEREAVRRMQIMQQQLNEEKSTLEKDKNDLTQKVDELTKQTVSTQLKADQAERKKGALTTELAATKQALVASTAEAATLKEKLRLAERTQAEVISQNKQETEKSQLQIGLAQKAVEQRGQALGVCEQKNLKLYQLNREILGQYHHKGMLGVLTQVEPLTGIESVRMENILQEYRDKLDAQKVGAAP